MSWREKWKEVWKDIHSHKDGLDWIKIMLYGNDQPGEKVIDEVINKTILLN